MLDAATLDEALAGRSTIGRGPKPKLDALPDRTPQITDAILKENLRRVRTSPAFVTEHEDGTRTFVHDPGVQRDVLISSVSVDRGKGSKDSISKLRDETAPTTDTLLDESKAKERTPESFGTHRDERGRFCEKYESLPRR
jgi:hypothetical protein